MTLIQKTKLAAYALFGTIGISAVLIWKTISPSEWAAWVQAVGSIAALLITGGLFLLQRQVEDQKFEDALLQARTAAAKNVASVFQRALVLIARIGHDKAASGLTVLL